MNLTSEITLPYNFEPRPYQLPLLAARDRGVKRLIQVWHRRAGKDLTDLSLVAKEMYKRIGSYYYFFPTYSQGKKILWDGRDNEGNKFLDRIPVALRIKTNETEMKIEMDNGSIFQVIGTDNIDSIVGTNPVGCVFSEYSLQDPEAWDYMRPILAANDGWALFNWTPRGENHAFDLHRMAEESNAKRIAEGKEPLWFISTLTVDDTQIINRDVLDQEREEIIAKNGDDSVFQQEYYVSYSAAIQGAFYGTHMRKAKEEDRITFVPHDPARYVYTVWDFGKGKNNAVIFYQKEGKWINIINFYKGGLAKSIPEYIAEIRAQNPGYSYKKHYAPHDLENNGDISTSKSRFDIAKELGFEFTIINAENGYITSVQDGIDAAKRILPRCRFDEKKCKYLVEALRSYHVAYDDRKKTFKDHPEHDWASHPADAFRYLAVTFAEVPDIINSSGGGSGYKKREIY